MKYQPVECPLCGTKHKTQRTANWCVVYQEFLVWIRNVEVEPFIEEGTTVHMAQWSRFEGRLDRSYLWFELVYMVQRRDQNRCTKCGREGCSLEVHHIVPRSKGGPDNPANLRCLCQRCHRTYTNELFHANAQERRVEKERADLAHKFGVGRERFRDLFS